MHQTPWRRRFIGIANFAILGYATVVIANSVATALSIPQFPALYVALFLIFLISLALVALHEFGHAATAALFSWRVSMIAVGPIAIKFRPFRLTLGTPALGGLLSGGAWNTPVAIGKWYWVWIAIVSGGPLVNIALASAIFGFESRHGFFAVLHTPVGAIGLISLAFGLSSLLPFYNANGFRSDGGSILDMLRGYDLGPRVTIMRLTDEIVDGRRPRDWDIELVRELERNAEAQQARYEFVLLYSHYFDCDDAGRARTALTRAVDKFGPIDALKVQDAFLAAFKESDFARARACLNSIKAKKARQTHSYYRAKSVLSLHDGDVVAADREAFLARKALKKWPLATSDDWEILDIIESKIAASSAIPSTLGAQ